MSRHDVYLIRHLKYSIQSCNKVYSINVTDRQAFHIYCAQMSCLCLQILGTFNFLNQIVVIRLNIYYYTRLFLITS